MMARLYEGRAASIPGKVSKTVGTCRIVLILKYLSKISDPVPQDDLLQANAVEGNGSRAPGCVSTRGDIEMRKLLLLSTFAALLATTGLTGAQESFFNDRFCAMTSGG